MKGHNSDSCDMDILVNFDGDVTYSPYCPKFKGGKGNYFFKYKYLLPLERPMQMQQIA